MSNPLGWISYNEGDDGPDPYSRVEIITRDGDSCIDLSWTLSWEILNDERDIVAYRVISDE